VHLQRPQTPVRESFLNLLPHPAFVLLQIDQHCILLSRERIALNLRRPVRVLLARVTVLQEPTGLVEECLLELPDDM
jgi:hypothetical protein